MKRSDAGSYRLGDARFRDATSELERLRIQADVAWPQELHALERHGLRTDAAVLEAGCGPGFVTSRLLEHLQRGSVTALDVDPAMLAHARDLVGVSERIRFLEASATATALPSGSFDIVVARFLLQHLPDPAAALGEFRRVLRPGGRAIVVDADLAFSLLFDPEESFYADLMHAVEQAQRAQGGDPKIGRRLPRLLLDAGFSQIAVDAVVAHSVLVGRDAIRSIVPGHALDHMEEAGFASRELAAAARDYLSRLQTGEMPFEAMMTSLVVSGSA